MKKLLSVLLAALMAFTSLAATSTAFAEEVNSAKVKISAQMGGEFVSAPVEIAVSADLSDKYAEKVGYNDSLSEPTILDAAIAAHIEFMGEDFMDFAPLSVGSSGWITDFFGNGSNLLYYVNGVSASSLTQTLSEGDYVDFNFLVDTVGWSDLYINPDVREKRVIVNKPIEISFTKVGFSAPEAAAGLDVTVNGSSAGTTDKDGKISLTFDKPGEYIVSSQNKLGSTPVFMPYIVIEANSTLVNYITSELEGGANYLYANKESFTVEESYILADLIRSGYKADKFAKGFADSVKENLDSNSGKLLIGENKTEDLGLYGAVITVFKALGYNPSDFNGYDLVKALNETDIEDARPHQYHYEYAIAEAESTRAKALIDDFTAKHYSMGNGMENWGYSCDNTCKFLIAIAPYAEDYKQYVDDAKAVIKTFLLEKGAYCDPIWNSTANADSTALSMAAFASVGDLDTAFSYYRLLIENYESNNTGVFTLDGEENSYATTDGLYALTRFRDAVNKAGYDEPEHVYKFTSEKAATCSAEGNKVYTCRICGETKTDVIAKIKHTPVTDKAVAPTFKKKGKTAGSHCSVCNAILTPQKTVKKLGAAKLKKVKKGKKSFLAKWKKVENVDGYQLQYSTNKKFKKNKKTVNIKKAKTVKKKVKKLKAKKTYYVRIRAYKTINGKKQYSKWSKAKKVKVK